MLVSLSKIVAFTRSLASDGRIDDVIRILDTVEYLLRLLAEPLQHRDQIAGICEDLVSIDPIYTGPCAELMEYVTSESVRTLKSRTE